jgi:large subunit ribosomal protein L21
MYAIIEDSGTQIKVSEGDVIKVDLRDLPADAATITFDRVLLIGGQGEAPAKIGTPFVEDAKVVADVLAQERADKVEIVKFKRRKRVLRRKGHRQDYLKVKVTSIVA